MSEIKKEFNRYKQAIKEIKELSNINPMTTCWTFLSFCEKCDRKEAYEQCPFTKLEEIWKICEEFENETNKI